LDEYGIRSLRSMQRDCGADRTAFISSGYGGDKGRMGRFFVEGRKSVKGENGNGRGGKGAPCATFTYASDRVEVSERVGCSIYSYIQNQETGRAKSQNDSRSSLRASMVKIAGWLCTRPESV
jgi:hypothetical protein